MEGVERAAESWRYKILSWEYWLSPNGALREYPIGNQTGSEHVESLAANQSANEVPIKPAFFGILRSQ